MVNSCKLIDKIQEDQVSDHDLVKCARGVEWDEKHDTIHSIDEWQLRRDELMVEMWRMDVI
jgi:hypothetical protein